jgi:2-iminobutanoate/2-iminopropanoate deaminase
MRLSAAVAVTIVAVAMTSAQSGKQIVGSTALPYSPAVKAGELIYVAGTLGTDAQGALAKGDIKAQTQRALDNISATLTAAGSGIANAASVTVYLRDARDFAAMNAVYSTYWPKDPPARTTVIVPQPLANADGLVEISMVAVPAGVERVVVHPSDWVKSPNPYSYGIRTGNTLFLAGLVSRNGKDNTVVKGDIAAQTTTVLDNGGAILKQAGMSYGDVVSARVFLTDETQVDALNAASRRYFTSAPPARTIARTGLTAPDYLVEITMVAVKDANRTALAGDTHSSAAIRVGNRLYLSGFTGGTASNTGDVRAQTRELLARVGRTLEAAGFDWSNVVDGVVYLPDMTTLQDMNAAYREVFTRDFPARATVGPGLIGPGVAVEITFTAVK